MTIDYGCFTATQIWIQNFLRIRAAQKISNPADPDLQRCLLQPAIYAISNHLMNSKKKFII